MIRQAIFLSTAAMTVAALPAQAAEVQIQSTGPVIELSVTESVKAKPDIATIGTGVSSEAKTAVEAMRKNAAEMNAVIQRIRSLGIKSEDIQTAGVSLNAQYDYNRTTRQQVFRGYQASNNVSVIVRDVGGVGPILDALVAAGATNINGPRFSIDDDTTAKAQARKAALDRAMAQARDYARWAGYSDVRILEISESLRTSRAQPMMRMEMAEAAADVVTPIEPGLVGTSVTVNVTFEMTR